MTENFYLLLPATAWLALTLRFTSNANIYADDAGLISSFENGNSQTYFASFVNWVPGRNLTIFFQYLFFSVTSTDLDSFALYHVTAQLFYVGTALTVGFLIFTLVKNKFIASVVTTLFLWNPLNIQITNWALAFPQHIISSLTSLIVIYMLIQPYWPKFTTLLYFGLTIMVFTYDQSAALAFFLIAYLLLPVNRRKSLFTYNAGKTFKTFSGILVSCYFLISYFGRKSLGHDSNISEKSLGLLTHNLILLPAQKIASIMKILFAKFDDQVFITKMLILLIIFAGLILGGRAVKSRLKKMNVREFKIALFFLTCSVISFLPAALWYPDKRHYYLPGALLMISAAVFFNSIQFGKGWRSNYLQSFFVAISLIFIATLQMTQLIDWKDRDTTRQLFYQELSGKVEEFPDRTHFFVDDSTPELNRLFYAELMPSAYGYYNNFPEDKDIRIHQISKIERLGLCTSPSMFESLYLEITLDPNNDNSFVYTAKPLERFCE